MKLQITYTSGLVLRKHIPYGTIFTHPNPSSCQFLAVGGTTTVNGELEEFLCIDLANPSCVMHTPPDAKCIILGHITKE